MVLGVNYDKIKWNSVTPHNIEIPHNGLAKAKLGTIYKDIYGNKYMYVKFANQMQDLAYQEPVAFVPNDILLQEYPEYKLMMESAPVDGLSVVVASTTADDSPVKGKAPVGYTIAEVPKNLNLNTPNIYIAWPAGLILLTIPQSTPSSYSPGVLGGNAFAYDDDTVIADTPKSPDSDVHSGIFNKYTWITPAIQPIGDVFTSYHPAWQDSVVSLEDTRILYRATWWGEIGQGGAGKTLNPGDSLPLLQLDPIFFCAVNGLDKQYTISMINGSSVSKPFEIGRVLVTAEVSSGDLSFDSYYWLTLRGVRTSANVVLSVYNSTTSSYTIPEDGFFLVQLEPVEFYMVEV